MDQLPSELVQMILPYLHGPDFIHIRQTCRRFKDIADNLEITCRPALWRRYVLRDFPRPCVESLAPWLYLENKDDAFVWKMLYTSLRKVSFLRGAPIHCSHLMFDSKTVNLVKDVKFFDRYLFLFESTNCVTLAGLDPTLWRWPEVLPDELTSKGGREAHRASLYSMPVAEISEGSTAMKLLNKGESSPLELVIHGKSKRTRKMKLPWLNSSLPETDDIGSGEIYISTWTNNTLLYHIRHVFGENVISVYDSGISQKWIELGSSVNPFKSLAFNKKWIVAVCENRRICIIPNRGSKTPVDPSTHTLRAEATKIKLLGDLVIVLYADGLLEIGQVVADKSSQVITNWQVLIERSDNYFHQLSESITDFAIHGQVFCAVAGKGKVFLSHFESLDHKSLTRNLHSPFTIPLENEGSLITRMSLDASDVLKVAVVETLAVPYRAKLHVLYLDKC